MASFAEKVLRVVFQIPRGSVMTYKQVAKAAGRPRAYRAVGNILHRNPWPMYGGPSSESSEDGPHRIEVPCHRVIKSNGEIGGYAGGATKKRSLLRKEGVRL